MEILSRSRNKTYTWLTFDHQKRFFKCERCGAKMPEEKGKEIDALTFIELHKDCQSRVEVN